MNNYIINISFELDKFQLLALYLFYKNVAKIYYWNIEFFIISFEKFRLALLFYND